MNNNYVPQKTLKLIALRLLYFASEEAQGRFLEPYSPEVQDELRFEAQQFFQRAADGKDDKIWFDILGIQPSKCLECIEAGDHLLW